MICCLCHKEKNEVRRYRPDVEGSVCQTCYCEWRRNEVPGVREAKKSYNADWQKQNPEKSKKRNSRRYANDPEPAKIRARRRAAEHPEMVREEHRRASLMRNFGLTVADYEERLAAQGGVCAICHEPENVIDKRTGKIKRLAVDHEHVPGFKGMSPEEKRKYVGSLLCQRDNTVAGQANDNPARLRAVADYLDRRHVGL